MKTLLLLLSVPLVAGAATEPRSLEAPPSRPPLVSLDALQPGAPEPPPFTTLAAMQAEFVHRFEETPGFGVSRVYRPRFLAPVPALVLNGATYRVVPPELIGLEDDPVVYAPRTHPQMVSQNSVEMADGTVVTTNSTRPELRRQYQRRNLTALETNAVLALRDGRDLVVLTHRATSEPERGVALTGPNLLVLGALRAGAACAKCHQCKEGTLLGAFAYSLTPVLGLPAGAPGQPVTPSKRVAALSPRL